MDNLRADCRRCSGLCCVAPAFAASTDFAAGKPAGQPCAHLNRDFRCDIHNQLRHRGYAGCAVFDCFGAGQHLTQHTFAGRCWRDDEDTAALMFAGFAVLRGLNELRWYLTQALSYVRAHAQAPLSSDLIEHLDRARGTIERLAESGPNDLAAINVDDQRAAIRPLLINVSGVVRTDSARPGPAAADTGGHRLDRAGADLAGRRFRDANLRGATLRGACAIGADFTGADLRNADLLGTDLRGARLDAANLSTSMFLTQFQINAAQGNSATALPATLNRPAHWHQAVP